MKMEFHPLPLLRHVLPGRRPLSFGNAGGLDLELPLIGAYPPLHDQVLPLLQRPGQGLPLVSHHELRHPNRIGAVCDIKTNNPGAPLLHLHMVGRKNVPLDGDHFRVQGDVFHFNTGKSFDDLSKEELVPAGLFPFFRWHRRLDVPQRLLPDAFGAPEYLHRVFRRHVQVLRACLLRFRRHICLRRHRRRLLHLCCRLCGSWCEESKRHAAYAVGRCQFLLHSGPERIAWADRALEVGLDTPHPLVDHRPSHQHFYQHGPQISRRDPGGK